MADTKLSALTVASVANDADEVHLLQSGVNKRCAISLVRTLALDDISDVTITTVAQGDILYYNGSAFVNLGPGTSGLFLQTQGAGANPQWADPATAIALDDLSDVVITTVAQGEVLYYNGSNFVNLGVGTNGQFLQTQGAAANPQWADAVTAGAAMTDNAVLRGDGGAKGVQDTAVVIDDNDIFKPLGVSETKTTLNPAGATPDIDAQSGTFWDVTLSANATFTFSNFIGVGSFTAIIRQDGTGGWTRTFPTTLWAGGTTPTWSTGANAIDVVSFIKPDGGTTWLGFLGGLAFS